MDSVIGKAIDLFCQYTVIPIARQFQYVFCYKSCVVEMNDALNKLQNDKEIVDLEKTAALHNMRLIHKKTEDWLEAVTTTQEEVSSLIMTNQQEMSGGCIIGGQIVNPVARHKLGRKATKKKQAIEELRRDRPQHDHEISYAPPPPGIVDHQATSDAAATAKLQTNDRVFRSSRWKEIMEEVMVALKDERINVVGLYGMGGVGKSTMISEVYDHVKKQCMFDEVIKVEVKVKPEIRRIQWEIAFQLGLKFESEWSSTIRADLLRERLLKTEKKKRVLIILDDLWAKLDLQEVGIPLVGNDQVHIKLLLTSRHEYLLSYTMGARNPIHLDVLSDADALRMFKFVVGVGAYGVKDERVTEIARKCSGLPIVIEATAKALKDRPLVEWEKIMKRLDNDDVLEKLKVSYDYLPSKESKDLFLICGISRGPNIQVRDLLKYTFGLRLYNRKDSSTLVAAAAKLEELLSGLEAASMLLKGDDNRYVKIHDRMRELAVKIVEKDHPEWAYDVTLSDLTDASELKLLLSCCEGDAVELQDSFLKDMEQLNVIEFINVRVALPLSSSTTQIDHMRNLRTLCLQNCCLVDISMIGQMKGLQILSFQGSDIRKLPIHLRELIELKMLDLSDCDKLTQIEPNVLGSLTKLEELNLENSFNNWEISQEDDVPPSNARLIELKNMSRLSNIRIHIPRASMLPKEGQLFSSKLSMYRIVVGDRDYYHWFSNECIKFSRVLMLTLDEYSSNIVWKDWVQTTMQTTEGLYLRGYVDGKCESISDLCTKGFECLNHLGVIKCPFRYVISSIDRSLMNMESLFLESLESLESLWGGLPTHEEVFNKLRVVEATYCNKLTHLFDFSLLKNHLSSQLEEIKIKNCAEMQCIVAGEVDNNNDVVTLSNTKKLEFTNLRKFSSFYGGSSSNVLFTGKKVAFPCLESLIIHEVDKLEHIWDPTDPPAVLGNLQFLEVGTCRKLVRVINSNVLMRLQRHLESLHIESCGLRKEVFDVDDGIISSCTDDGEHDLVLFSRLKKLYLRNMCGNLMVMKGGMSSMTIFPNIELLDVSYCRHLRYALCCSLPTTVGDGGGRGVFENLEVIRIGCCDEMEAIVAVKSGTVDGRDAHDHDQNNDAVSYSYSSLEEMRITHCPKLRTFGQYLPSSELDSAANHNLPFFSQKEILPCLRTLYFEGLSMLGEIWAHEVPSDESSFKLLKYVDIYYCAELSVVFPSTLIPRLENLTGLNVKNCYEMRQIIMDVSGSKSRTEEEAAAGMATTTREMMFTFPRLRKLILFSLQKLDRFYSSSSACGFQFPSLETLQIQECDGVKSLFSGQRGRPTTTNDDSDMQIGALFTSCDVRQLVIPNLKSMTLDGLLFWKGEEKPQGLLLKVESLTLKGGSLSCTELVPVGVATYLTELTVKFCDELEYLFTTVGAASLVHLTRLSIGFCYSMKAVVVGGAIAISNEENNYQGAIPGDYHHIPDINITFHHLKVLRLIHLPMLEKFSSVDKMVLNFPSLEKLDIQFCRKMATFSSGIATASAPKFEGDLNSFVHNNYLSDDDDDDEDDD